MTIYFNDNQIHTANETDIVSYLQSRGVQLKRRGSQWLWEEQQVWLNGCKWFSHYENKGGRAVEFMMKFYDLSFTQAVGELIGSTDIVAAPKYRENAKLLKPLIIPPANRTMDCVFAYLIQTRCIDRDVVEYFAHNKTLYEDAVHHNAVFVGTDENGAPKHIHKRGTNSNSSFRMTESGSDARYSFHHIGTDDELYVFEAPIDVMAFITLNKTGWQSHSYVALCCTAEQAALYQLTANPNLQKVYLCLDNDEAGEKGCDRIANVLSDKGYSQIFRLTPQYKDWDEDLQVQRNAPEDDYADEIIDELVTACSSQRVPQYVWEKVKQSYQRFTLTPKQNSQEQYRRLSELLLLFIKDEYRKNETPVNWDEICAKLKKRSYSTLSIADAFKKLQSLRESGKAISYADSEAVINAAIGVVKACMKIYMECDMDERSRYADTDLGDNGGVLHWDNGDILCL